jgi:hypothetical protein
MSTVSTHTPIGPQVRAAIEQILQRNLAKFGYLRATIEPGDDRATSGHTYTERSSTASPRALACGSKRHPSHPIR